jgi:hypothetical protein
MEITIEMLDKHLTDFKTQQTNLTAQVHAISGAIQILEVLKKQLTDVGQDDPSI